MDDTLVTEVNPVDTNIIIPIRILSKTVYDSDRKNIEKKIEGINKKFLILVGWLK